MISEKGFVIGYKNGNHLICGDMCACDYEDGKFFTVTRTFSGMPTPGVLHSDKIAAIRPIEYYSSEEMKKIAAEDINNINKELFEKLGAAEND